MIEPELPFIPKIALQLAEPQSIATALEGFEATFYSHCGHPQPLGRVYQWIRETSIYYITEIQALFSIISLGSIAYYTHQFYHALPSTQWKVAGMSAFAFTTIASYGLNQALHFLTQGIPLPNNDESISFTANKSLNQRIAQILLITKVVITIALSCFDKHRPTALMRLSFLIYSLWKNSHFKWLTCKKYILIINGPIHRFFRRRPTITFSYSLPIFHQATTQTECAICLETAPLDRVAFCVNHLFHTTCITRHFQSKRPQELTNGLDRTVTSSLGILEETRSLPCTSLPSCPLCRNTDLLSQNTQIHFHKPGRFSENIIITGSRPPPKPTYEQLHLGYSLLQAGLSYLQTYPELAVHIFKIQQWMIISDTFFLLGNCYYLAKKPPLSNLLSNIDSLYERSIRPSLFPHRTIFELTSMCKDLIVSFASAATFLFALSYLAIIPLNTYLRSNLSLKATITPFTSKLLNFNCKWTNPFPQKTLQALFLARIISSIGLTFFSEQSKITLLNIAAQSANLTHISHLRWIELSQTLTPPFKEILQSSDSSARFISTAKKISIRMQFMVNSACAHTMPLLQETMTSIIQMTNNLFKESRWSCYWHNIYRNGALISSRLIYKIFLPFLSTHSQVFLPNLTHISLLITNRFYGVASVIIRR